MFGIVVGPDHNFLIWGVDKKIIVFGSSSSVMSLVDKKIIVFGSSSYVMSLVNPPD